MDINIIGLDLTKKPELFKALQNPTPALYTHWVLILRKKIQTPLVLLATCDRIELYTTEEINSYEVLERTLSLNSIAVKPYRYSISGKEGIIHLFLLSTGVISPLFGEDSIISQLSNAYFISRQCGNLSAVLSRFFNMAIAFGKRIKTQYSIDDFDLDFAVKVASYIPVNSKVLIIGSGNRAKLIADEIKATRDVYMTLRDEDKTFLLPVGVKGISYDRRKAIVKDFDVVISATYGLYHTFDIEDSSLLENKLVFDLAPVEDIPQNIPAIRIDDLDIKPKRREELYKAIYSLALAEYDNFCKSQERAETITSINESAEDLSYDVIRRSYSILEELGLSEEKKKAFLDTLYENVRKAYITSVLSKKQ